MLDAVPEVATSSRLPNYGRRGDLGRLAAKDARLEALYAVVLAVGLRQGEALGLRWQDVDLEKGIIRVVNQLQRVNGQLRLVPVKTVRGRRSLLLPVSTVGILKEHWQRQIIEKRLVGERWRESGLVFVGRDGSPLEARSVIRWYKALLRKSGLPDKRFHDLRHSCATLLLVQGVPPRVVMEILGHSDISMTMNTYSHVVSELQVDAAARMEAVLTLWGLRVQGE